MKRTQTIAIVGMVLILATMAAAGSEPGSIPIRTNAVQVDNGQEIDTYGAKVDTTLIMGPWGSGAPFNGQFETELGAADWNGWYSVDLTAANGPENTVGDFAWISESGDMDPCANNTTPQALFVNNGQYVDQGLEPEIGDTYRYGPLGHVVEFGGGLAGEGHFLNNSIRSPVMAWPDDSCDGIVLDFDVYTHEELGLNSPGMFVEYRMRSTDSDNPADIENVPFTYHLAQSYGSPKYRRFSYDAAEAMVQDRKWVQIELAVRQFLTIWQVGSIDGTAAPYFDNVRLGIFPINGPAMSCFEAHMANDGFPASGVLDPENLANNSVRFDMARNIAPSAHMRNDPGDSLVITCVPRRDGSVLAGPPVMHYLIKADEQYDDVRGAGYATSGTVEGIAVAGDNFAFDLPDSGFLFPGDVIHYYFRGVDDVGGDQTITIMPADTTGFSGFASYWEMDTYNSQYVTRCLPSYTNYAPAQVLFIDDTGCDELSDQWVETMGSLCELREPYYGDKHVVYPRSLCDIFRVRAPSSGLGNGIGGRATAELLSSYDGIIYSSGSQTGMCLADQNWGQDPSNDVNVIKDWLSQGERSLFLCGDNLATDLATGSGNQNDFLSNWLGLHWVDDDLTPGINGQFSPQVQSLVPEDENDLVFYEDLVWQPLGGCPTIREIDAVTTADGAIRVAEFLGYSGETGNYPYSAATLSKLDEINSKVISMPYDLATLLPENDLSAFYTSHQIVLIYVFDSYFGIPMRPRSTGDTPSPTQFSTSAYPNPFNPEVKIEFNLPKAEHLSLNIYNVRGELVKTLVNEAHAAGPGEAVWNGTTNRGAKVSSGVYFYEVRTASHVKVEKIALVK